MLLDKVTKKYLKLLNVKADNVQNKRATRNNPETVPNNPEHYPITQIKKYPITIFCRSVSRTVIVFLLHWCMLLNIISHSINIIIFFTVLLYCAMCPSEMITMRSLMKKYHGTTIVYQGKQWYTMVNSDIPWYTMLYITCTMVH